ncbi:MAG: response regulator [Pseudomonadota bacterium]
MNAILSDILLVEDDAGLRTMLRGLLEINDFKVVEADRREPALQLLRSNPGIQIVILDFGLPPNAHDISEGLATLKAIQAEIMTAKVIVLTGQDQEAAALEAIREGAFDFLAKPAGSESILRAIKRASLFLQKENELSHEGITRIAVNAQIGDGLKGVRTDAEERLVRQILKETGFNVYQSAKRLGVKRENIYYFMKKFGISRDD